MKILAMTLELMARMAIFTAITAMSLRYMAQRQRPAVAQEPSNQPRA